jgi:hypothetical protein
VTDLPESANRESDYAREGTAMHSVMDTLMRQWQLGSPFIDLHYQADKLIGEVFDDIELTANHVETMILPALDQLEELMTQYASPGAFTVQGVERRVRFPGIPGAYGTCDLILCSNTDTLLVDWKFGQGVGVSAIYAFPDGEIVNPQLLFYAAAAFNTAPKLFTRRRIIVAIVQPRLADPVSSTVVLRGELKQFREDLERAVVQATGRNAPLRKGEWCRFCPAKITCPKWTGPVLDLSAITQVPRQVNDTVPREPTAYGKYLANAKALVDMLAQFKAEIDGQLHAFLEEGGVVPGWRLKLKAKQRQWVDEDTVHEKLRELGFDTTEIFATKLRTFQQTDATAKKLGVKVPDELRVAPPTTETTIATTDDPAPVVERSIVLDQFRASLKALEGKKGTDAALDQATATGTRRTGL